MPCVSKHNKQILFFSQTAQNKSAFLSPIQRTAWLIVVIGGSNGASLSKTHSSSLSCFPTQLANARSQTDPPIPQRNGVAQSLRSRFHSSNQADRLCCKAIEETHEADHAPFHRHAIWPMHKGKSRAPEEAHTIPLACPL